MRPTARMRTLADRWLTDDVTVESVDLDGPIVDHVQTETVTAVWSGCALVLADSEATAIPDPGQKPVNTMRMTTPYYVTAPQVGHRVTVTSSEDPRLVDTVWTIEQVITEGIITSRIYLLKAVTV